MYFPKAKHFRKALICAKVFTQAVPAYEMIEIVSEYSGFHGMKATMEFFSTMEFMSIKSQANTAEGGLFR